MTTTTAEDRALQSAIKDQVDSRLSGILSTLNARRRVIGGGEDENGKPTVMLECSHEYTYDDIYEEQDPHDSVLFCWRCSVSVATFTRLVERVEELEHRLASLERGA